MVEGSRGWSLRRIERATEPGPSPVVRRPMRPPSEDDIDRMTAPQRPERHDELDRTDIRWANIERNSRTSQGSVWLEETDDA